MGSPWKFLSRLVSAGRKQKPDEGTVDDGKLDVLAIAGPTDTPAEENFDCPNRSAAAGLINSEPFDQVSAKNAPSGGSESKDYHLARIVSANFAEAGGSVSSDETDNAVAALGTATVKRAVEGTARKTFAAVNTEQFYPAAQVVADGTLSLDAEIKVLKGQLASKLRTQNAQLKKMLERFER